jgi:hypothetical protein
MSHFTFVTSANLAKAIAAASLACCMAAPVHARDARMRLADQKLDPQVYQQQLQDTREDIIKKEQSTIAPPGGAGPEQLVIDICKKNPNLPQCRLK